ncbi:acyltransferase [Paenibacillus lautus]|uniref:Acyltransferase 3 domain-containing protein n=1 Tax=Paenibacillus lautus TaxID=1401 RepID=A0A385TE83_PAELA|nr:acyltransferase family protein [Paenibacillus lautus]AYB41923.1 hypothetical protein D5F53_00805 [Paenibacillus lautus]
MTSRVKSYDYLRVLAAYAVILVHTSAPILYLYNDLNKSYWMIGNAFDSMARWCVPVFFMLSGSFLLEPKSENLKTFFLKRLNKVLIPLFAWSIIYYVFSISVSGSEFSLKIFVKHLLADDIYFHLWFLYVIIGLYLLAPLIRVLIKNLNDQLISYSLIVWFLGVPMVEFFNHVSHFKFAVELPVNGYLGYFILGYYLREKELSVKITRVIHIAAIICIFMTFFGVYYETVKSAGVFSGYYYGYLTPNTAIISISIFLLFKGIKTGIKHDSLLITISKTSLGIYLIHALILKCLSQYFNLTALSFHPILSIPFISILTFVLSALLIFILQRIPVVNKIVP